MKRVILHDSSGEVLMLDNIYPVGSIYMSVNSTDPATLFGGTWQRIKDCFLLAAGDTYTAGSQGGEADHTLTVDEMPAHNHALSNGGNAISVYSDTNVLLTQGFVIGTNTSGAWYGANKSLNSIVNRGGVRLTTTCRRISPFTSGKGQRNTGKVVQLNGRQESSAARQRGEQSVPADLAGPDLSRGKYLYQRECHKSVDILWRDVGEDRDRKNIDGSGKRFRSRANSRQRSSRHSSVRKDEVFKLQHRSKYLVKWRDKCLYDNGTRQQQYSGHSDTKQSIVKNDTNRVQSIELQRNLREEFNCSAASVLRELLVEDGITSERRCA